VNEYCRRVRIAALALALCGCAHAPLPDPAGALEAWRRAVERDDPHAAWQLLSADTRAKIAEPAFIAEWRATSDERHAQAEALRTAPRPRQQADVLANGRVTRLTREADGWRLDSPRASEPGARAPEEALRRFVQAIEERNFDAFLRLLAEPLRALVERELSDRLAGLRTVVSKPIAPEGQRATVRYGSRYHIDIVEENGQWRVSDFN
jgi:hypothetical protein